MTKLYDAICGIEDRWSESKILVDYSKRETNLDKKSVLNGAAIVLQVAHFESSLKEICGAVIDDINQHQRVKNLTVEALSIYVRNMFDADEIRLESQEGRRKIEEISRWVSAPLLLLDKNKFVNTEGNPTPKVFKKLAKQFGVSDMKTLLSSTRIDYWLSTSTAADFEGEIKRLKAYVKRTTKTFPYSVKGKTITFGENATTTSYLENSLNECLRKRNNIAHGGVLGEIISDDDVAGDFLSLRALTLYFASALALQVNNHVHT